MIIMGQWTWVENNNEVFLRVTNHTGQVEKNLLGPAGIQTRGFDRTSKPKVAGSNPNRAK